MKHVTIPPKKGDRISLLFIGDIFLGGEYAKYVKTHNLDYGYAFKSIKNLFSEADVVFCNLESPLFTSETIRQRGAILYAPVQLVNALKTINCKIVNLGNNHINDYGDESLIRTKQYLEKNGFITVGAGRNISEALEPKIVNIGGIKIAFLSFTTASMSDPEVASVIATNNSTGCANFDDPICYQKIREVKRRIDYLIISLHWGYQHYYYPSPEQIEVAHKMIEEGADIIIGHHPHVVQGIERYKHGIIFYSLGNFFFPDFKMIDGSMWRWSEDTRNSFAARFCLNIKGQMKYDLIPFTSDNFIVTSSTRKKEKFLKDIFSLSKEIKNENYGHFWSLYCKNREKELKRIKAYKATRELFESLSSHDIKNIISKISIRRLTYLPVLILKYSISKIQERVEKILRSSKYEKRL